MAGGAESRQHYGATQGHSGHRRSFRVPWIEAGGAMDPLGIEYRVGWFPLACVSIRTHIESRRALSLSRYRFR